MATVGELFIQLGVKGADKTVVSINAVSHSIKETASVSLEAKAAILGAMYALEQFFSKSGAAGSALTNFNTLTGVSAQKLQEYQYAAKQVGVSNQETENTFKNLQSAMEKQVLGVSRVSTWSQLSAKLGGTLGINDVNKFAKDPALLMQKLQQYAQLEQDVAKRNETLRGFGISDNMIVALSKGAFNQDAFAKAPKYSDREIAALDRANTAWGNLSDKIAMAVGHLNAAHGEQLVAAFSKLINMGLKFADILLKVAERSHFFEIIEKGFNGVIRAARDVLDPIERFGLGLSKVISAFSDLSAKGNVIANLGSIFTSIGDSAKSILSIADAIFKLVEGTKLLGTEMNAFQIIAKGIDLIFQGWAIIFKGISTTLAAAAEYLNPSAAKPGAKEAGGLGIGDEIKGMIGYGLKSLFGQEELKPQTNTGQPPKLTLVPPAAETPKAAINLPPSAPTGNTAIAAPKVPLQVVKQGGQSNVTVNQSLNFQHEGRDSQRTANDVGQAARRAINQMKVTQVN